MASKTLGNLTDATALTGTEQVYVVQSSNSRKATTQDIADLGTSQDNMTDGTTNKNYTATEQTKLAGIATGAEVNVSPDWNASTGDGAILNKPTLRELLTANRTYYVATTGSDTNDGLTSGAPFLTLARAVSVARAIDCLIYDVTIQIADGTYGGVSVPAGIIGGGTLGFIGNTTTPGNVVINSASSFTNCLVRFNGVKFAGTNIWGLNVHTGAIVAFGTAIEFGDCGSSLGVHIRVDGGTVNLPASYTISGGALRHFEVSSTDAKIITSAGSTTITVSNTPAFGQFAYVAGGGLVSLFSTAFSGAATGQRYNVSTNGVVNVFGAGESFLPGSTAGSKATGGQYA